MFEIEFSQISKEVAIHVYKQNEFKEEITFPFKGKEPAQDVIEEKIDQYIRR